MSIMILRRCKERNRKKIGRNEGEKNCHIALFPGNCTFVQFDWQHLLNELYKVFSKFT